MTIRKNNFKLALVSDKNDTICEYGEVPKEMAPYPCDIAYFVRSFGKKEDVHRTIEEHLINMLRSGARSEYNQLWVKSRNTHIVKNKDGEEIITVIMFDIKKGE